SGSGPPDAPGQPVGGHPRTRRGHECAARRDQRARGAPRRDWRPGRVPAVPCASEGPPPPQQQPSLTSPLTRGGRLTLQGGPPPPPPPHHHLEPFPVSSRSRGRDRRSAPAIACRGGQPPSAEIARNHVPTVQAAIGHAPLVAAMDPARGPSAKRAG